MPIWPLTLWAMVRTSSCTNTIRRGCCFGRRLLTPAFSPTTSLLRSHSARMRTEVALTGDTSGGVEWITALYDINTGNRKWLVVAPEGTAAQDVVMDATKVYVTGLGNVGINSFLTVVAYDRVTGARLWRTDKKPADAGKLRRPPHQSEPGRERRRDRTGAARISRYCRPAAFETHWRRPLGGSSGTGD